MNFDPEIELADIRRERRTARRRRRRGSRLARFRAELVQLRRSVPPATLAEIVVWLRRRRVRVAASTVHRYLARLPELGGGSNNAQF